MNDRDIFIRRQDLNERGEDQTYTFWDMDSINSQPTRFGYSRHVEDHRLIDTQYLLQASAKVRHVLGGFDGDVLLRWASLANLLSESLTDRLVLRE